MLNSLAGAHTLRLGRDNARHHLAFGSGIHSCAGAALARTEARISAERLLARMRDIRISDTMHGPPGARRFEHPKTFIVAGVAQLHLDYTPAAGACDQGRDRAR